MGLRYVVPFCFFVTVHLFFIGLAISADSIDIFESLKEDENSHNTDNDIDEQKVKGAGKGDIKQSRSYNEFDKASNFDFSNVSHI